MNAHDPSLAGGGPSDDDPLPPIESLDQFEERVGHKFRKPFVSKFGAMFLDQLDAPGLEFEYLIDGWLSVGDRSIIGGKSQSGKSFLAIHAGMCVAHCLEFFGSKVKPGLVVYQAGEGARGVKRRLRAWRKHHGVLFSRDTPFVLLQSPVDLWRAEGDTPKLIEEIKAICELRFPGVPLRMVIIDTLATATVGASENDGKDMGLVMSNVAKIGAATGAHVCLVHHMNAGGEKLRGHTSIYANTDQIILVEKNETTGIRTARLEKQKDGEPGEKFTFELMSVGWGDVDANGKPVTSCVCLPVGQKEAIRRVEENRGFVLKPKTQEEPFMKAFFAAETTHGRPVPPSATDISGNVRAVVNYDDVKRTFLARSVDDEIETPIDGETQDQADKRKFEREKKRRQRAAKDLASVRDSLTRFNVIGFGQHEGEWLCWWTGKALRAFPQTIPRSADAPIDGLPEDSGIPF
jgi:hypothetical protein